MLAVAGFLALVAAAGALWVHARPVQVLESEFARQAWLGGVAETTVQVGDTTWSYYAGGTGETVVLVHGFTGSKENWLEMLGPLTKRYRVVVPDLAGWGESTRHDGADYGIAAQAERLRAFLDAVAPGPVHLAGHSMGGHIAGVLAARHPGRLATLALVDAAGVRFAENAFARRVLDGATPFNFSNRAEFDAFMHELFVSPRWLPGPVKDVLIERNVAGHAFHAGVLDRIGRGPEALLLESELANVATPAFILWCRGDLLLDVSSVDTLKQTLTTADVAILEDCSHMPMMEKPGETAAAYLDFLAKH